MKKYAKTACDYLLIGLLLIACTAAEYSVITPFVYLRISAVICICLCLAKPGIASVATGAVCGFLADIYSFNLPVFSLLYLYISSGCVWSVGQFVLLNKKTVFMICFLALLGFFAGEFMLNLLIYESSGGIEYLFMCIVFALINASPSPVIYGILKRVQF